MTIEEREKFWQEQTKKCIEGTVVNGKEISGSDYFYINFIKVIGQR